MTRALEQQLREASENNLTLIRLFNTLSTIFIRSKNPDGIVYSFQDHQGNLDPVTHTLSYNEALKNKYTAHPEIPFTGSIQHGNQADN